MQLQLQMTHNEANRQSEMIARQSEMLDRLLSVFMIQQQASATASQVDNTKHKTFAKDIKLDMPSFKDAHAKQGDGHLEVKEILDKWASAVKVKYHRHQPIDPNDAAGPKYWVYMILQQGVQAGGNLEQFVEQYRTGNHEDPDDISN
jgi:hypothetical protein